MLQKKIHPIIFEDIDEITSYNLDWDKFKNKTILISGINGFLASYLAFTFLHLNEKYNTNCIVIGVARNRKKLESKFGDLLNRKDFKYIVADVCEKINIDQKIDFIIHAASQSSPKYYSIDPVGTLNANVLGTNNLLLLAKENNIDSFLYFSSGEVYGDVDDSMVPTKEDQYGYLNPLDYRSCYAESKRLAETMCISWLHQFNIPVKIVRPFHTYGPGIDLNDGRVYADFVSDILNNRDIILKSKGTKRRAFCYISDATKGFLSVLIKGINGKAYNVGNSNEEVSIFDLAQNLCTLFPEKKLKVVIAENLKNIDYIESPIKRNCPDTSSINNLGWFATTSINEGFKRTVKSFL